MFAFSLPTALTRQIKEKYEEVKEREHTSRKKKSWCEAIERIIKQSYPTSQLILVGSSATSFATEGCDVDLTLIRPNTVLFYGSASNVEVLRRIQDGLRSIRTINTELIAGAVVPILKLNDWHQGLEGDISVDIHNSIFNTYLQKCYANMDSRVTPLVVTIKHWAKVSGITCARDHKLSGFAVALLVLYYLQRGCTPALLPSLQAMDPSHFSTSAGASVTAEKLSSNSLPFSVTSYMSRNNDTLGDLLVGFFNFYCEFDWYKVISVKLAGSRHVPSDKKWTKPYIRIEDPFDCKNVTRAVYEYPQFTIIMQAIRRAKQKLANSNSHLNDIL